MWVVCDDDEDLDEEGTVDYPNEEATSGSMLEMAEKIGLHPMHLPK